MYWEYIEKKDEWIVLYNDRIMVSIGHYKDWKPEKFQVGMVGKLGFLFNGDKDFDTWYQASSYVEEILDMFIVALKSL